MGRKEEIVAAARKIVVSEGLEAVSVRRVAAEAGIGASTLRYYFPSNRELLAALTDTTVSDLLSDENVADTTVPADERLCNLMMQFLPQSSNNFASLESTLSAFRIAFESGELTGHQVLRAGASESETAVKGWLMELESQGEAFTVSLDEATKFLLTVVNGLMIDLIAHAPQMTLDDARNQLLTAVRLILE